MTTAALPTDSAARKGIPLMRGCFDYFPSALAEVARLSQAGNDKHNPGEELHHSRGKSSDHADCILRHLVDRGKVDDDGFLHEVKVAWRALALLQEALEAQGAPLARGARLPAAAANEPVAPGDGGWIQWSGGENPVPGRYVKVRFRDEVKTTTPTRSETWCWKHAGNGVDIVAYRVVD